MREEGYYWVKFLGEWTIGYWLGDYWGQVLRYQEGYYTDDMFQEIDENIITR